MFSDEIAIKVSGLGKAYSIYEKPHHRLFEVLGWGGQGKQFWALRGLDFEVRRGETVGIVGRNGSGKSTLLQVIAGTLQATEGHAQVNGRVAALLELGSGFNPEFTGRENVYMNASILGLGRAEVDSKLDRILAFADIGEFIDQPIRNYSSGMVMRLAFSVIAHVDADILIVDEALSVGDAFFTQKCMRFLRDFKERGTLLFVSHDDGAVTGLCDRALWLHKGSLRKEGPAKMVMASYLETLIADREGRAEDVAPARQEIQSQPLPQRDFRADLIDRSQLRNDIRVMPFAPDNEGFGEQAGHIVDVALLDESGRALAMISGGESVVLEVTADVSADIFSPIVGFYLKDRLGQLLFGDNTYLTTVGNDRSAVPGGRLVARFAFQMPRLQAGDYFITAGLAEGTQHNHVIQHWLHEALIIKSEGQGVPVGIIGLPMHDISLESIR